MEPYDVELGPIQRTFESLFKSIAQYFQSTPVVPVGMITETNLSSYSQDQLRDTLNSSLKYYGFTSLPSSLRLFAEKKSQISGIHRSDNITTYDEKLRDGSHRTYNFYSKFGPENMKTSYYWLNMRKDGEQTQGILTEDDRWYLRIITSENKVYYLRIEREIYR